MNIKVDTQFKAVQGTNQMGETNNSFVKNTSNIIFIAGDLY